MDTSTTLDLDGWTAQDAAAILPLTEVSMSQLTVPMIGNWVGDDTARTRKSDPPTSHAAADSSRSVSQCRALVLSVLTHRGPLADHELVDVLRHEYMTPQRVRTARHELVERGLVENTGATRKTATGRDAVVWAIVEGRAA